MTPTLLLVGVEARVRARVLELCQRICGTPCPDRLIETADEFMRFLDAPDKAYDVVVAGAQLKELPPVEIAQSIRAIFQNTPLLYCSETKEEGFQRPVYIKNGFTDAYLLPFDQDLLRQKLEDAIAEVTQLKRYRSVQIVDLEPGSRLDFDTYIFLPQNRKYIRYAASGDTIDRERVSRLKGHQSDPYSSTRRRCPNSSNTPRSA